MATFQLDDGRLPYEKQSKETGKAFAAFALFRDLGPQRTLPKTVEAGAGVSVSMLSKWSSTYRWFERAEAYDMMVDARMREQRETLKEQMLEQHRYLGTLGVAAVIERLRGREPGTLGPEDEGVTAISPESMDWADVARVGAESVRVTRLSMGEPTDFIKGALQLSPAQAQTVLRDVVEILMPYIPGERQPVAWGQLEAYFDGGGSGQPALTA